MEEFSTWSILRLFPEITNAPLDVYGSACSEEGSLGKVQEPGAKSTSLSESLQVLVVVEACSGVEATTEPFVL